MFCIVLKMMWISIIIGRFSQDIRIRYEITFFLLFQFTIFEV